MTAFSPSVVRKPVGTFRQILGTTVDADPASLAISNQPRGNETLVSTLTGRDLKNLGLR